MPNLYGLPPGVKFKRVASSTEASSTPQPEQSDNLYGLPAGVKFKRVTREKPKEEEKPERSTGEKIKRGAQQFGAAALSNALLPYEIATLPLAIPGGQESIADIGTGDILSDVYGEERQVPGPQHRELAEPVNIDVRSLLEKGTGADLHPEGFLEHAIGWRGMLTDPKKWAKGFKALINPSKIKDLGISGKDVVKALLPGQKEIRSAAVGAAMEMADQGQLGPIGHLALAVGADIAGHGPTVVGKALLQPKKTVAQLTNLLTANNSKKKWISQFVEDAKSQGIQLDAGTLTGSNLVKMAQAKAAQSGLSGEALENFRKDLSGQIMKKQVEIFNDVGDLRFENSHQAAESIKENLKAQEQRLNIPELERPEDVTRGRSLRGRVAVEEPPPYEQNLLNRISPAREEATALKGSTLKTAAEDVKKPLKEAFDEAWREFDYQVEHIPTGPQAQLANEMKTFVEENKGSLIFGESTAESRVVQAAEKLANQLSTEEGALRGVSLANLIRTKRTFQDLANYEFGGSNFQSAYKKLAADVDSAINRTMQEVSPELSEGYRELSGRYSEFKDLFENKNVIKLFEPNNHNYNSMYESFLTDKDKLRSLEDIMYTTPRGQQVVNQVKRDLAERVISKPTVSQQELVDLAHTLGPEYAQDVAQFMTAREHALANPTPRAAKVQRTGKPVEVQIAPNTRTLESRGPLGRVTKEAPEHVRAKAYDFIKDKSTDQIMKMMDSIGGIRKLKRALELTPEGKQLFKELSRYKIDEMITKKMMNNTTEQVKLGTFSNLLKTTQEKAIAKELMGSESFKQLMLLQKTSGRLAESASKFFNASQSGVTAVDVGMVSSIMIGLITGNPFAVMSGLGSIGGLRVVSSLFSDPKYLKYLEEAVLTKNPKKFTDILKKMEPSVKKAMQESMQANRVDQSDLKAQSL